MGEERGQGSLVTTVEWITLDRVTDVRGARGGSAVEVPSEPLWGLSRT